MVRAVIRLSQQTVVSFSGEKTGAGDGPNANSLPERSIWARRGQTRAFIIGPDGTTVLWQSPSGRWGTDISGLVFPN